MQKGGFLFPYIDAVNFLAHIYLSNDEPLIQIGNFMADSVRKSQLELYKPMTQLGVHLHWFIDDFTDQHEVVKESKKLLYPIHGKYSSVLVDIYYDHFLAKSWESYHKTSLRNYVDQFYDLLKNNKSDLPSRVQHLLPYMVRYDWLYNYQFIEGIERVLGGMSRRASFENSMQDGARDLIENYSLFQGHFDQFFPELIEQTEKERERLILES